MNIASSAALVRDDEGIGLIEIVVSMFMLALLAIAFLPLLVQGARTSAQNVTLATATQLVNQQMNYATALTPTCTAADYPATTPTTSVDSRGVPLQLVRTASACPTSYPGTVKVTATVTRTDTHTVLASASTLVYMAAAG